MSTSRKIQIDTDNLIGVDELCAITGYSKQTIYNNRDKYPHIHMGKFLKFVKDETLAIIFSV